jgi:membrane dipeptidase
MTGRIEEALALHRSMLTVDTHCDTPGSLALEGYRIDRHHGPGTLLGGDLDLPRMRAGGLGAVFFAVFVPQGARDAEGFAQAGSAARATFERLERMFQDCADDCALALAPQDAVRIRATGRRAIFLGMENGHPLGQDLDLLDEYHRRGIRYLTLCHAADNEICASSTDCPVWGEGPMVGRATPDGGLTPFGERVVQRMNRLGMMVDVSHLSERSVDDVLALSRAPVLASHSGARAIGDHPRNLTDRQLRAIAAQGGVVHVLFVPDFIRPRREDPEGDKARRSLRKQVKAHYREHAIGADPRADAAFEAEYQNLCRRWPLHRVRIQEVADHIDHVAQVAGIEHVGIGSDFDGGARVEECRDVSELPALTAELMGRGYSEECLRRIWGGNVMRVFGEVIDRAK